MADMMLPVDEDDYFLLLELNNIIKDGYWDDPNEPGHAEKRKRWNKLVGRAKKIYTNLNKALKSKDK